MYKSAQLLLTSILLTSALALGACGEDEPGHKRVLLVVSNHGDLGDTGVETGVWMAELTHPYWKLVDSGLDIDIELASPDGGDAPIDAFSVYFNFDDFLATGDPTTGDPGNDRFIAAEETGRWIGSRVVTVEDEDGTAHEVTQYRFTSTLRLGDVEPADYDAIYFAGGNGAMWQLPDHADVQRVVSAFYEDDKIVAAACHGSAALLNATLSDGSYLVAGRRVTGFSNAEEEYLGQAEIMPLLLQDAFGERGAQYVEAEPWTANVVVDGRLISGQNPPSAEGVGEVLVEMLAER